MKPFKFHTCCQKYKLKPAAESCFTVYWCQILLKISPCSLSVVVLHDDVLFLKYMTSLEIWPRALWNLDWLISSSKFHTRNDARWSSQVFTLCCKKSTLQLIASLLHMVLVNQLPVHLGWFVDPRQEKGPWYWLAVVRLTWQTMWSGDADTAKKRLSRANEASDDCLIWC